MKGKKKMSHPALIPTYTHLGLPTTLDSTVHAMHALEHATDKKRARWMRG